MNILSRKTSIDKTKQNHGAIFIFKEIRTIKPTIPTQKRKKKKIPIERKSLQQL
jgi:hypothetical protein